MGEGNKLKCSFIGSGRAASTLSTVFHQAGHHIVEVLSTNEATGKRLARSIDTRYRPWPTQPKACDIVFICVPDDAIPETARILSTEAVVLHCSGSIAMKALEGSSPQYGVFYPIQTMKADGSAVLSNAAICIEGNTSQLTGMLQYLAESISSKVYILDSEQRRKAHLAAVFANNFACHIFSIAKNYLRSEGLPEELLDPLIASTASQSINNPPYAAQTGPAVRGDESVMRAHLEMLKKTPGMAKIYTLVSESIRKQHEQ